MASRFAVPTHTTLQRYRAERDCLLVQAQTNYNNHGSASLTMSLLVESREKHRKVLWARKYLRADADAHCAFDCLDNLSDEDILNALAS